MRYLIRAAKYLLAFCVLYLGVVWISIATNSAMEGSVWDYVAATFATQRGKMLMLAVVVLSAIYPRMGFMSRRVKWDMENNYDRLLEIFAAAGFSLKQKQDGKLIFRANNIFDKLIMLFEDEITVTVEGDEIVVEGIRRGVARVIYRYLS